MDAYATRNGAPVTDLRQDDFEVLEDGNLQRIEQFERVSIQDVGTAAASPDPNTVAQSRHATQPPRARVFVVFLDVLHVEATAGRQLQKPLIDMADRLLGPDDLVAVMTPDMSARDITFAHETTALAGILSRLWGERDRDFRDAVEEQYAACYPGVPGDINKPAVDQGISARVAARMA